MAQCKPRLHATESGSEMKVLIPDPATVIFVSVPGAKRLRRTAHHSADTTGPTSALNGPASLTCAPCNTSPVVSIIRPGYNPGANCERPVDPA